MIEILPRADTEFLTQFQNNSNNRRQVGPNNRGNISHEK